MGAWLTLYEITTQLIIWLGQFRDIIYNKQRILIRKDRTFISPDVEHGYLFTCCDCGAQHKVWVEGKTEYMQPCRPYGYEYKLRFGAKTPTAFESRSLENE